MPISIGGALVFVAALLVAANAWLASGAIAPLRDAQPLEFIVQLPSLRVLAVCGLVSAAAIAALARLARGRASLLSPLLLLALPLCAVGLLATPFASAASPWLHLFVDLRWWFFAAVAVLQMLALRGFGRLREPVAAERQTAIGGRRQGILEAALVAVVAGVALFTSPVMRFQSVVVGDEPKYLRFTENWYQGHGLDISRLTPLKELTPEFPPDVAANFRHLGSALSVIADDATADVRRVFGSRVGQQRAPTHGTSEGAWFIEGRHGGVYQSHHPGVSLLLFPGYFIDRYFLNWTNAFHAQFPSNLYATGITVLLLYALWAAALFRFLVAYTGELRLPWMLAAVAMLSLPATAFSYQYYPEAAGGFVLTVLAHFVVFGSRPGPSGPGGEAGSKRTRPTSAAFFYGLLAGFLMWMHPRWGPAAVVAGVTFAIRQRENLREVGAFWTGLGGLLFCYVLYTYYIAGSVLPWTMYETVPESPGFTPARAAVGLPQLWFNWRGGLIAHAPVYLLALPGLIPFFRGKKTISIPVFLMTFFTAVLVASHGWSGTWSTPGRLVAAIVPFLTLPMADAVKRFRHSRWFVVPFVLLAVLSLHNGMAYNQYFDRQDVLFNGPSVSGWKTPLMLPRFDGESIDPLLYVWLAITVALIALPVLKRSDPRLAPRPGWTLVTSVVLVTFAASASIVAASTGINVGYKFQIDRDRAVRTLAQSYLNHPGGTTWSSQHGSVSLASVLTQPTDVPMNVNVVSSRGKGTVHMTVSALDREMRPAWGTATVDFGDGETVHDIPVVGSTTLRHEYPTSGVRLVRTRLSLADGREFERLTPTDVQLKGLESDLPRTLEDVPASVTVDRLVFDGAKLVLRCRLQDRIDALPKEGSWLWLTSDQQGIRRGQLIPVASAETSAGSRELAMVFHLDRLPQDWEMVTLVAAVRAREGASGVTARSPVIPVRWPAARFTAGAPLVMTAEESAR
jgi:hypothetical protein